MKLFVLRLLKALGIFRLSKFLIRNKLIILAYHGFEVVDEASFRPKLFIRSDTFKKRLEYLKQHNFSVIALSDALEMLEQGTLPKNSVVITIDDGWNSTKNIAWPIICSYKFPATLYLTTYYVVKNLPVINVLVSYLLWLTKENSATVDFRKVGGKKATFSLATTGEKEQLESFLNQYLDSVTAEERIEYMMLVASELGLDLTRILQDKRLSLLNELDVKKLSEEGLEIELHTHRHQVPLSDTALFTKEIIDNRYLIEGMTKKVANQFCYPSGVYNQSCESTLKAAGVKSATTCLSGVVDSKTNRYFLPRMLDGENIPQLVFEAEVCGVNEYLRKLKKIL